MKNSLYYFAVTGSFFLFSCGQGAKDNSEQAANLVDYCYQSISGPDTADLTIRTDEKGKVTGDLIMKYGLKPNEVERVINNGKVDGRFSGDTLFLNYLYNSGKINKTLYQNPLALLKKDDKLMLGVGQIVTSVGRSYFDKSKPIDFEKGRFKFDPIDCK
ncbi:hypothetical protein [Daejeonella oryzae]|uniref:hypothetical protein n=1 Tax=Daejeonella oryzae TaxID=1122943 RepID=UPI00041E8B81|nr:hypothetical protein [Daejeonella oryzae]